MIRRNHLLAPAALAAVLFAPRLASAMPTGLSLSPNAQAMPAATQSPPAPGTQVTPAAPAPATPAPTPDRATAEPRDGAPRATTGFVLSLGGGAQYSGGEIGAGYGFGSVVGTLDVAGGMYVTPHLGVMAGVKLGYVGFATTDCDGCKASSFQIPVVVQYAFEGRHQGAYLEGGVGAFSVASSRTPNDTVKLSASSGADVKIGVGYRIAPKDKLLPGAIDLKLNGDIGRFSSLSLTEGSRSTSADIAEEKRALHYTVGLNVAYLFAL